MAYLLTHSLLRSWNRALSDTSYAEGDSDRDLYGEFMETLHRVKTQATPAMQNGIHFENLVTSIAEGTGDIRDPWYCAAEKVARGLNGACFQAAAKKWTEIHGMKILLYGRLDALKAGVITDIKYSGQYEVGQFLGSTQHPMYFELVPEAYEFVYKISNGRDVFTERYYREDTSSIYPTANAFFEWLDSTGLMNTYQSLWETRH